MLQYILPVVGLLCLMIGLGGLVFCFEHNTENTWMPLVMVLIFSIPGMIDVIVFYKRFLLEETEWDVVVRMIFLIISSIVILITSVYFGYGVVGSISKRIDEQIKKRDSKK